MNLTKNRQLIKKPFEYLLTKWIYANQTIPKRIFTFLGLSMQDMVAKREDVMIAIQIAYDEGYEDAQKSTKPSKRKGA